jgi:hypothetical protein
MNVYLRMSMFLTLGWIHLNNRPFLNKKKIDSKKGVINIFSNDKVVLYF